MIPITPDMPLLDRMVLAVERVRDRLARAVAALEAGGIPYAVAGGNAVAAWVATVDTAAVRNTQDVDILLHRNTLEAATAAMAKAGFIRRHVAGIELFLDGAEAKPRDAVHIVMAGEKVRAEYATAAPDVTESQRPPGSSVQVLTVDALVRMKLTSYRDKDRTHLRDMLEVELIDASWLERLEPEHAARLKHLIDTPGQ